MLPPFPLFPSQPEIIVRIALSPFCGSALATTELGALADTVKPAATELANNGPWLPFTPLLGSLAAAALCIPRGPADRIMLPHVVSVGQRSKVLKRVVELVAVDMVYVHARRDRPVMVLIHLPVKEPALPVPVVVPVIIPALSAPLDDL